jgi:hypothetical protein
MNWIRDFGQRHLAPVPRIIDDAAPDGMRNELVDLAFDVSERSLREERRAQIHPVAIHNTTGLMLGEGIAGQPYGGYQVRVARDIGRAEWPRVYDWISRFWEIFDRAGFGPDFRNGVNVILAANGVVWDLDGEGHIVRILPGPLGNQINSAHAALAAPEFAAAREVFDLALRAFNDRPRRERDACANAYDALESAAKIRFNMPAATFGEVLSSAARDGTLTQPVVRLLRAIEVFGHGTFRHGMAEPFALRPGEVDFVFTGCASAILVFAP